MNAPASGSGGESGKEFSPATAADITIALRAFHAQRPDAERALHAAVIKAAIEARQDGLPPERLVIALKAIVEAVPSDPRLNTDRDGLWRRMLHQMLVSYYGDPRD